MYDTDERRYGIETTNHAECYNIVMRRVRGFPLVGIVEFIMYGCIRYFRERYASATPLLNDPGVHFCRRVNEYMEKKLKRLDFTQSYRWAQRSKYLRYHAGTGPDRVSADKG